jgi:hypothetical protein
LDGETVVPAGSYVAWRVPADANPAQAGVLTGELRARAGAKDGFAVAVLSESDFTSWKKGYRAYPIYLARHVDHVELNARLPKPDVYYVVISNPLDVPHESTIRGTLRLSWLSMTNAVASATPPSGSNAVQHDMISFGLVLLLAVALATWSIHEERAKAVALPKRAA